MITQEIPLTQLVEELLTLHSLEPRSLGEASFRDGAAAAILWIMHAQGAPSNTLRAGGV